MTNVVVIGSQWGDEGKGKIVDWLSARAQLVVRFQGGHNAGHTLVVNGVTYKLRLLPSGIVRRGKQALLGNGVVIDPWALIAEMDEMKKLGVNITPKNFMISERAPLILPFHAALDAAREDMHKRVRLGTTKRGIGPAYEDKVARRALRVIDLYDNKGLKARLSELVAYHNIIRQGLGLAPIAETALLRRLHAIAPKLSPFVGDVAMHLHHAVTARKHILFEGAQGGMLDVDHGTYPFVTSSNTLGGQAATGTGLSPHALDNILGITKAYTTRVGEGPFPTEQDNAIGYRLGQRGKEFGTVTGRKRRCGWFDAVLVRQAVMTAGITGLALTKLDVLDDFDDIKICVGYTSADQHLTRLPAASHAQANLVPIYETMPGWKTNTSKIRHWRALPLNARRYARRLEALVGAPIVLLSTSPHRADTILLRDPFAYRPRLANR